MVRVVGKLHQLSAGLVTGGRKEFEGEQDRIVKMNILVATPGRLLQVRAVECNLMYSCGVQQIAVKEGASLVHCSEYRIVGTGCNI